MRVVSSTQAHEKPVRSFADRRELFGGFPPIGSKSTVPLNLTTASRSASGSHVRRTPVPNRAFRPVERVLLETEQLACPRRARPPEFLRRSAQHDFQVSAVESADLALTVVAASIVERFVTLTVSDIESVESFETLF